MYRGEERKARERYRGGAEPSHPGGNKKTWRKVARKDAKKLRGWSGPWVGLFAKKEGLTGFGEGRGPGSGHRERD